MLTFQTVKRRDGTKLRRYYRNCPYGLCEYSLGVKLMWRKTLHPAWAEAAGCLVVRNEINGQVKFDYPVPGPEGDVAAALDAIDAYCQEQGISPGFFVVPESCMAVLLNRYPYMRLSNLRSWRDYVYYREDLQLFAGRRYSGQRNHIKNFYAKWPQAEFRQLTKKDQPAIEQFWLDYQEEFQKDDNSSAKEELKQSRRLFEMLDKPWFAAGGMWDGQRLIALSLAERCDETLVIHIEKALYSYPGVYPALVQAFVGAFGETCRWINREDDAADPGLRRSKTQYGPAALLSKYSLEIYNELSCIEKIPELKTQRLTLTELRETDIPAYNALVMDTERNRWWGYDDVGSLRGELEEESFYRVAQQDFRNRQAINFAIRLDGRIIGEAVLYRFDCRGSAELGCRIDKTFSGHGYGTEAFAAVANWALYEAHLSQVVAKCFKENTASFRMLSACMRKISEDETYFYFEKKL